MKLSSNVGGGSPPSAPPVSPPTAHVVSFPYTVHTDHPDSQPTAIAYPSDVLNCKRQNTNYGARAGQDHTRRERSLDLSQDEALSILGCF